MKNKKLLVSVLLATGLFSGLTNAKQCKTINWSAGKVININASLGMGTRVQLPMPLLTDVMNSNNDLWDINGASSYIVLKPNSNEIEGKNAMMFAFLSNGQAIDFQLTRVPSNQNEPCVILQVDNSNKKTLDELSKVSVQNQQADSNFIAQNIALQKQITGLKRENEESKAKAVTDALTRYRYHIYTRYEWDTAKNSFLGSNLVSDVYDDGRFTYIRLTNNNKGLLSIMAEVGGKTAIIPFKYNDSYSIYQISGIYPEFTMKLDKSEITIKRTDNKTKGAY